MASKLTYDFVKQSFARAGYKLISKEYKNSKSYLEYECPKGHVHKILWNSWQQNVRCPHCANNAKLTYEQVKQSFEKEGYELKSKEYGNNNTYLEYKCSKGHYHKTTWANWQQGKRCPHCANNAKLTYEQVEQRFAQLGYTLVSRKYENNNLYFKYKCPKDHLHKITWKDWEGGKRCSSCVIEAKITYEKVKDSFANMGYKLLSKEYVSAQQYLKYKCPKGHTHKIKWNNWQQGQKCPSCYGNIKLTYEQVKQSFAQEGYELKSEEYKGANRYLKYKCPKGHVHKMKWGDWQQGIRCGKCTIKRSKAEKEIVNYIRSIYNGTIIENDRSLVINPVTGWPLELDILMPDINKAIEYNGYFWHNTDEAKAKDAYKQQWCKDNNIDLLVINDQDWLANKDWNAINIFISACA